MLWTSTAIRQAVPTRNTPIPAKNAASVFKHFIFYVSLNQTERSDCLRLRKTQPSHDIA